MTDQPTPTPPTTPPVPPERLHKDSVVLLFTGDGKGKSSAAWGTAIRARARDWSVSVVQFLKSEAWKTGEHKVLTEIGVDWAADGAGFTWDSDNLDDDQGLARAAWEHAKTLLASGEVDVLILDEITYPVTWGWIEIDDVIDALATRAVTTNVVMTGRDAHDKLIAAADTATRMEKISHAFDVGVMARRGLDF